MRRRSRRFGGPPCLSLTRLSLPRRACAGVNYPPTRSRDLQPVQDMPGDRPTEALGLCLSGGGYRAMLFHLGVLWRLNEIEMKLLKRVDRISSVSGGSITAATLGLHWSGLDWKAG